MNKNTATVTVIAVIGTALAALFLARRRKKQIPSDFIYPIIGNLPQLSKYTKKNAFHEYMLSLAKFGKIARFVIGSSERILLNDAAEAKRILLSSDWDKKDESYRSIGLFEHNLVALTGEMHKKHRKAIQPAFGPTHLRNALLQSVSSTKQLINQWKSTNKNAIFEVDILKCVNAITMDVIGRVALGQDLEMVDSLSKPSEGVQLIKSEMDRMQNLIMKRNATPQFLWSLFGLSAADARHSSRAVRAFLSTLIETKKKKVELNGFHDVSNMSHNEKFESTASWDVIDRLLAGNAGAKGLDVVFTDDEIRDETFIFFTAGSDTTALTLTSFFVLITDHPLVVDKIHHEIDAVLGIEREPTDETLPQLKYLDCVIKEVMRYAPVVSGTQPRTPLAPTTVCGYEIKPGQGVSVNTGVIHRNPEYWQDPDIFWPERWENGFTPVPGSYVPFGSGIANCIGQRLANIESRIVAALLLQSYDIELVEGQKLVRTSTTVTGYKGGLLFRFKPRGLVM